MTLAPVKHDVQPA